MMKIVKRIDSVRNITIGVMIGLTMLLIFETIYVSIGFGSYSAAWNNAHEIEANANVIEEIQMFADWWIYGARGF